MLKYSFLEVSGLEFSILSFSLFSSSILSSSILCGFTGTPLGCFGGLGVLFGGLRIPFTCKSCSNEFMLMQLLLLLE